jgi:hypothetical protein
VGAVGAEAADRFLPSPQANHTLASNFRVRVGAGFFMTITGYYFMHPASGAAL